MPLPDERKSTSASSLIARFEARAQEAGEAPLIPTPIGRSPRTSPQMNSGAFQRGQPSLSPNLGAPSLTKTWSGASGSSETSHRSTGSASLQPPPSLTPPPRVITPPIERSPPPPPASPPPPVALDGAFKPGHGRSPSLALRTATLDIEPNDAAVPGAADNLLTTKVEGLAYPSSPKAEGGRLSAPSSPLTSSPPPTAPASLADSPEQDHTHGKESSGKTDETASSGGSPTRQRKKSTATMPTAASLAKSRSRVESPSNGPNRSPVLPSTPLSSGSRPAKASPTMTRISPTATKTSPASARTSPATKTSPTAARLSGGSAGSPTSLAVTRNRSASITSATSSVGGAGRGRTPIPTSGTPRSRKAAAEAAAAKEVAANGTNENGRAKTPQNKPTISRPSSLNTSASTSTARPKGSTTANPTPPKPKPSATAEVTPSKGPKVFGGGAGGRPLGRIPIPMKENDAGEVVPIAAEELDRLGREGA